MIEIFEKPKSFTTPLTSSNRIQIQLNGSLYLIKSSWELLKAKKLKLTRIPLSKVTIRQRENKYQRELSQERKRNLGAYISVFNTNHHVSPQDQEQRTETPIFTRDSLKLIC